MFGSEMTEYTMENHKEKGCQSGNVQCLLLYPTSVMDSQRMQSVFAVAVAFHPQMRHNLLCFPSIHIVFQNE